MAKKTTEIQSVFSKYLAIEARKLAAQGKIKIIETRDFPDGAPLHEDGSCEYDPRKPLVILAVSIENAASKADWASVCREFDRLRA